MRTHLMLSPGPGRRTERMSHTPHTDTPHASSDIAHLPRNGTEEKGSERHATFRGTNYNFDYKNREQCCKSGSRNTYSEHTGQGHRKTNRNK